MHIPRFFSYLSGFTAGMLIILCSGNYFVLFIGWEGDSSCLKWIQELYFIENNLSLILSLSLSKLNKRLFYTEGKLHSHKRIGPHNLDVIQVIIGLLLGDGHLEKRTKGIGSRLIVEQTNRNIEYLIWIYQFFNEKGYCNNKTPKLFKRIKKNNTIYFGFRFNTYTFSTLNWLHKLFYSDNHIKRLPLSFLYEYLNPMALALWFMGDGSKLGVGFKIATNCFIRSELEELCNLFFIKFKINCSLQKNNKDWIIYIKKNSAQDFSDLIEPYMLNSMKYKLGIYSQYYKDKNLK
jgi:LAGLIDADG DNA endonuclease family